MTIQERYRGVLEHFAATQPEPQSELSFTNAFETLVAVMLSAQCTDARVNMVTPALFAAYPTAQAMAAATAADVLPYIASVSYPNSKAAHLVAMARMLVDEYGGQVPDTMDALTRLPGVGRKTANVVLGIVYGQATIPVDTHVYRVARRLGLSRGTTPEAVERDLTRHIPEDKRFPAHHWLLLHGRYTCMARKPHCDRCSLTTWCRHYGSQCTIENSQL